MTYEDSKRRPSNESLLREEQICVAREERKRELSDRALDQRLFWVWSDPDGANHT